MKSEFHDLVVTVHLWHDQAVLVKELFENLFKDRRVEDGTILANFRTAIAQAEKERREHVQHSQK